MSEKWDLIDGVLDIELSMFQRVPAINKECQESPETFELIRRSTFETWSEETLRSYHADLMEALEEGINLMTEKYARIDGLLPFSGIHPLIDNIIKIEVNWQKELSQKYPHLFIDTTTCGVSDFEIYLRSELETYSYKTLEFFFRDVSKASIEGKNLTEEGYLNMFQKLGYNSLEEVEREKREV